MTLTQSAAIEAVRARLSEETPGFYTDSQIRSWLNEGQREVARRALWKRTSSSSSVVAGTQFYSAPSTAIQIYRVEFTPTGSTMTYRLEYRDINAMDVVWGVHQSSVTGIPSYYTMVSANPPSIELCPVPSSAGTLKVYFYAMPTDLATTNNSDSNASLDVPAGWEDLVVEWATALGFRKARDVGAYQIAVSVFSSNLSRLTEVATRYTDEPQQVVPDYSWSAYFDWDY